MDMLTKYIETQKSINSIKRKLWSDKLLQSRVKQISKLLLRGVVKPPYISSYYIIEHIVNKGFDMKYPICQVDFDINEENIIIVITAVNSRGDTDSSVCYNFPVKTNLFDKYIKKLEEEAEKRELFLQEAAKRSEIQERQRLKELIQKYPDILVEKDLDIV